MIAAAWETLQFRNDRRRTEPNPPCRVPSAVVFRSRGMELKTMVRWVLGLTAAVACLSMIAAPANEAAAQGQRRPAAAARPAPHAVARPAAPRPQMARPQMARPHMARPHMARPAARPHVSAPRVMQRPAMRSSPHIAAPRRNVAPRVAPTARSNPRLEQRQRVQHNRQNARRGVTPQNRTPQNRTAGQQPSAAQQQRLQALQSKRGKLNRTERRELRQLHRNGQQTAGQATPANPQRLQALRQQAQHGRLNRGQRQELRQLQRADRQQRLQTRQAGQHLRTPRARQVTRQQAAQGRFASAFRTHDGNRGDRFQRRGERRAEWRMGAHAAWRLGHRARHVPWYGPVYWPYAYNDVFYYTFWPDAYEPAYWAYAYDDFFDGIFFPDGAPYSDTAYDGPYLDVPVATGSRTRAPSRSAASRAAAVPPGQLGASARQFCADQAKGVTAWPFEQIAQAVEPTDSQKELLAALKKASSEGAAQFKEACPKDVPLTPPGRLQAMTMRLQATLDTIKIVQPPLAAFYESLNDEQKARFNAIGPKLAPPQRTAAKPESDTDSSNAACGGGKAGLSGLATEQIEQAVQPNDQQYAALDRLDQAMQKAVDDLQNACPNTVAQTPVGRLELMQKRLEAMVAAANAVRPALDDFYASLNDEQKATFNRLNRDTAQSGG